MNIQEKISTSPSSYPSERIVTLDFLRGVAIFGMTLFHILFKVYDVNSFFTNVEEILNFPIIVLIIMGLFGYLGSWYGFFLFISSIVTSLVYTKKVRNNIDAKQLLKKSIVSGVILIIIGYLVEGFGYYGDFGYSIRLGTWTKFQYFMVELLWIQTLQIIGFCLILNGLILFLMMRKEGYMKEIRNITFYICLILFVFVLTPFASNWIANTNWQFPAEVGWPDIPFVFNNRSAKTWIFSIIAGPKQPLLPYLATSFVGSLIGLFLAKPKPSKRILAWFSSAGIVLIAIGVILIVRGFPFTFLEQPPAISTFLVRLGGQICLLMLLLALVEFRGKGAKYSRNFIVKFFRRWSVLSLTIYALHILELLPRWILTLILQKQTGLNFMQENILKRGQEIWMFLVIVYILLYYNLVVRLLLHFKMKGSLEWMFVKAQDVFSGVKSSKLASALKDDKIIWSDYKTSKETP
ncbi:MAG: hypothetical protein KAS63_00020 [Candidatus Heimdallarchaeota archaeon]|nr:hypothetical protein [Candidatus Heimdallarchaeota archaeon]MCK4953729.1 hypothetical protein [Candidatus Heimdallarchaeota archaeon]